MIEPTPDLASDLDWMLQSGQANREMLIEALVDEYFQPVYRLAVAYLNHPAAAWTTTIRIFSTAVTSVYRYRSSVGATNWFFSIVSEILQNSAGAGQRDPSVASSPDDIANPSPDSALEAALWSAVDGLSKKYRLPFLLHSFLGWSEKDIARLQRQNEAGLRALLAQAEKKLRASVERKAVQDRAAIDELMAGLAPSLQKRWPSPYFSPNDLQEVRQAINNHASRQGSHTRLFSKMKEVVFIGGAILAVLAVVWGANILLPEPEAADLQATALATRSGRGRPSSIRRTSRPPKVTSTPTPFPSGVFYPVEPGESLDEIAAKLGTRPDELQTLNRIPVEQELKAGQNLLIPGKITPSLTQQRTAVPSLMPESPDDQSLDSSAEIQSFMRRHWYTWDTLWVDAFISSFGPEGYHGPAVVNRVQFWVSRDQFLILSGSPDGNPEEAIIRNGPRAYRADLTQSPWFSSVNFSRNLVSQLEGLSLLFDTTLENREQGLANQFELIGKDQVVDREALVVVQLNGAGQKVSRLWVDAQTGFILRRQVYSTSDSRTTTAEISINSIAFNPDLNQELLDPAFPWRGGFARDESGAPELDTDRPRAWFSPPENYQIGYTSPPEDFNPAHSRLTFQFPTYFEESDPEAIVDLFADEYYLGKVQFGNPWSIICARSPDGMRIAYAKDAPSPLHWFKLNELDAVNSPFPAILTTHFAFSPDSKHLAVFNQHGVSGSVDILDLDTGDFRHLVQLADAKSFVWSPDGEYVAMIGRVNEPAFDEAVMVVDAQSGEITYSRSIDYETGNVRADWPPLEWGVEFPLEMGGLEVCTTPP